jgi:AraC family transcriptional regulator, positive regulator of tynA and feaB
VYDLIGALFAPSNQSSASVHSHRLFECICDIIKDRFSDPSFGPCDIAGEIGISRRYLQKVFTARGLVCHSFIQSVRLNHAARLLHRRARLNIRQPLTEIADTCGFNDYRNTATFIAGLRFSGVVAPMVLNGPINGVCFQAYVE